MNVSEDQIRLSIQDKIYTKLDYSKQSSDEDVRSAIDAAIAGDAALRLWPVDKRRRLATDIFDTMRRLDILQGLLDDPTVSEIMINGPDSIFIEQAGHVRKVDGHFESQEKLLQIIQRIVSDCNRTVNESSPIVDARLAGGERVNVVLNPIALNGPILTIRRFPDKPVTMSQMIEWQSISDEAAEFLEKLVQARYNIFISGGTGSGKTTFLNVLSGFIPKDERIITIEDSAELQIQGIENLVRLETRNANVEGCNAITIRDLIKSSLRMRPDRIIVGEVRGAEAMDVLSAMNTGHDGSISTGHANSAQDMLARLQTMILMGVELPLAAIRQQLASGIDILVHLGRLRDKSRKVLSITEIDCYDESSGSILTHDIYKYNGAVLEKIGELSSVDKLKAAEITLC